MRRMKYVLAGISILLLASRPIEAESKLPLPQGFDYKGKPIQPDCIQKFVGGEVRLEPVFLETDSCQKTEKKFNSDKLKEGFLGYSFPDGSYIYYKYLGPMHLPGHEPPVFPLIYTEWSGGGTGHFNAIDAFKNNPDSIVLMTELDAGDRCNGGLSDVAFTNGVLTYKKNVTPWALYSITQGKSDTNIDFSDCAVCCVGTVSYKGSDIVKFEYDEDAISTLEDNANSPAQKCFNKMIKETFVSGKTSLTMDELKSFGQKVKEQCLTEKDLSRF